MTDIDSRPRIKWLRYEVESDRFHSKLDLSTGDFWDFAVTNRRMGNQDLQISCRYKLDVASIEEFESWNVFTGMQTRFTKVEPDQVTAEILVERWKAMCWIAACMDLRFSYSKKITSQQVSEYYHRSQPHSFNTIASRLGVFGTRLFIYFNVEPEIMLDNGYTKSGTLRFLKERNLVSKVGNVFPGLTPEHQEFFTRKGTFQPLL